MTKTYNRDTNKFEETNTANEFLQVLIDEEREDKAEVVTLINRATKLVLPLNSDDDTDTFKAVELFKKEDRNFVAHIDFFKLDNPKSGEEILNT